MSLSFKIVQLFKERSLGPPSSHGTVCRAKCDGVHCAAKIMSEGCYSPVVHHKTSFKKDRPLPAFKKLEQEVEFLGTIRHAHLVQYLGIHRDPVTGSPVLLMELMDCSLTEYLESSTRLISYHQQAGICFDVAQALSFLHSYGVVHRCLSSNNVLLDASLRAKVGDFGTSKLVDLGLQSSSKNARIDVYLPPESITVPPHYGEKTDSFSFGVLVVQILTRLFPSPSHRSSTLTEVERRQDHICMIDLDHPLLPTALACLRCKAWDRPTAQELCQSIESVKDNEYVVNNSRPSSECSSDMSECSSVVTNSVGGGEVVQHSLKLELEHKNKLISDMKGEIEELRRQLEELKASHSRELAQKNWMIAESEIRLGEVGQKLRESETARASLESQSVAFETWAAQPLAVGSIDTKRKVKLEWVDETSSPFTRDFSRFCCNAVVDGDVVCFKTALSPDIYAFDSTEGNWSQLPPCPHVNGYCSLVSINGLLTTVGDYDYGNKYSNRLFSLTALDQKWKKVFPNMPTKRCLTTTVCTKTALIVAGGRGENRTVLRTVEVLNTETSKWLTASDLPEPLFCSTATVCGDRLYLIGGKDRHGQSTPAVYACSLSALLKSCKSRLIRPPHPLLQDSLRPSLADRPSVWNRVANLPVVGSTCVSVHGQVLAVGGRELNHEATTTIYVYNASTDSWAPLDHRMSTPRSECFAAVLPDNRLLIAGGYSACSNIATSVEVAAIS